MTTVTSAVELIEGRSKAFTEELRRMLAPDVLATRRPHRGEPSTVADERFHCGCQLVGREAAEDEAAAARPQHLLRAAARCRDDRDARAERFRGRDAEALLTRRQDEERRAGEGRAEIRRVPDDVDPAVEKCPVLGRERSSDESQT